MTEENENYTNIYININRVAEAKGLKSNRSLRLEINKPESKYIAREVKVNGGTSYEMLQFMDFPIDNGLIDSICETVNQFIRTLIGRGALIDGKCTFNADKNPTTELANGHLTFDIEFMPPTPAERITFESFINIELLKSLGAS